MQTVEYDNLGRMRYHPEYHPNHGKPWMGSDQKYLIERYVEDGPESVSLALGRTIHTIMEKASKLRKAGVMPRPKGPRIRHARSRYDA